MLLQCCIVQLGASTNVRQPRLGYCPASLWLDRLSAAFINSEIEWPATDHQFREAISNSRGRQLLGRHSTLCLVRNLMPGLLVRYDQYEDDVVSCQDKTCEPHTTYEQRQAIAEPLVKLISRGSGQNVYLAASRFFDLHRQVYKSLLHAVVYLRTALQQPKRTC